MGDALLWVTAVTSSGVVLCIGISIGKSMRVQPPKPERPRDPDLFCGCGHELAYHDPQSNRCVKEENVKEKYDPRSGVTTYKLVQCACRQYTGDKPVDTFFSPRISLPEGETL